MRLQLQHVHRTTMDGSSFIQDFNLSVNEKEFLVLAGPRGCGKSTILRMIAGLEDMDAGEIYIDDVLVNELEPKDRSVAMVFSNSVLYPDMTVLDNMAFSLKQKKMSKAEITELVEEAAELLGIRNILKKKPRALNPEQAQKVILGRAIAKKPKILLLDDPFVSLDDKLKLQMWFEVSVLYQKMDTTIVYVTNDPTAAMALGTKVVIMKHGRMMQMDAPMDLYETPSSVFAAEFFGNPPINLFEAHIMEEDGYLMFEFAGYRMPILHNKAMVLRDRGYIDKDVIVGIRPEDIKEEQIFVQTAGESVIKALIRVKQMLGATTYLDIQVGGIELIASVNPRTTARAGDMVKLAFDARKLHFFDKKTQDIIVN
ncbi:ABC transporter ATP-binding protein [Anaerolentibacter hominis]|uniref:ABC transporter ATP-binding protein n=1 Tax=Anaerolentibacter hominis TaxID=3079009 RepID=UPI0031B80ED2